MSLYVVTGGAGFIGSHLVDALLAEGHSIRVVDDLSTGKRSNLDSRAELIVGCVSDAALMQSAVLGAEGVFHLAAVASVQRSNEAWVETHRANLTGTIATFEAARREGGIPVVYASSAAVYGDAGTLAPIAEKYPTRPVSAYGADKLGSELHAQVAFGVHRVPTMGFRFFNVYGPRQDPASPYSGVISIFAGRITAGQGITINGDGGQTRDFIYVADIVRHLVAGMAVLEAEPQAVVLNACTGRATSVLELARTLGRIARVEPQISFGPARVGDIRASLGDPRMAQGLLGIAAETRLPEGLEATLGWLVQPALRAA